MTTERDAMPALTGAEMAGVDRVLTGELGFSTLQLMETAGRAVALFARERFLGGNATGRRVAVLCGTGGNGGDGMVAARHLCTWGAGAKVWITHEPHPDRGVAAQQLTILRTLGLPVFAAGALDELASAELVIDGLLGFSLTSAPTGTAADLIRVTNRHPAPVLAIDLPSGLDATTGEVRDPCIRATATLTLGLPKTGLLASGAAHVVGELVVADLGVPAEAYRRVGKVVPPVFAASEFLTVRSAK